MLYIGVSAVFTVTSRVLRLHPITHRYRPLPLPSMLISPLSSLVFFLYGRVRPRWLREFFTEVYRLLSRPRTCCIMPARICIFDLAARSRGSWALDLGKKRCGCCRKKQVSRDFFRVYVTLSSIVRQDHSRARGVHGVGFWKERLQVFQKRTDILEI